MRNFFLVHIRMSGCTSAIGLAMFPRMHVLQEGYAGREHSLSVQFTRA
jgi:hypothetical protein